MGLWRGNLRYTLIQNLKIDFHNRYSVGLSLHPELVLKLLVKDATAVDIVIRLLAKVPNTPPRLLLGETKHSFGGVGFLFLIYARGLICLLPLYKDGNKKSACFPFIRTEIRNLLPSPL